MSQLQSSQTVLDPEDWVDAYGDNLYRYAFARLRDRGAAEEVVQETFLAGIRFQNQYSGDGSQAGWLMGILKRKILDHIKSHSKHGRKLNQEEFDPATFLFDDSGQWRPGVLPTIEPDEQLESSELWTVVHSCLRKIPQGQADVFVLSVMEGMENEKICKELGISASNLWVRLHRARLGLAKCVATKWFDSQESESRG